MTINFLPKKDVFEFKIEKENYYQTGKTCIVYVKKTKINFIARITKIELIKAKKLMDEDKYKITMEKWPTCRRCKKQYEEEEGRDRICKTCYHLFETPEINEQQEE